MKFGEYVAAVAEKAGVDKKDAEKILKAAYDVKGELLASKDSLTVPGFGSFQTKDNPARTARNPATGADIQVPAKTVAKFKPAKALSERLNG